MWGCGLCKGIRNLGVVCGNVPSWDVYSAYVYLIIMSLSSSAIISFNLSGGMDLYAWKTSHCNDPLPVSGSTSLGKLAQVMKKIHRRLMKIMAEFYQPCKVSNIKTGNKSMFVDFSLIPRQWRSGNETIFVDFSLIPRQWWSGNETTGTYCPTRALLFLLIRNKATTPSRPAAR